MYNTRGEVVAVHNSWDELNDGQRHGVSWFHLKNVVGAAEFRL